ncbi:MAG: beta-propeller fold lactonase family protein [Solirubrobacteraceae bacterium]
MALVAALGLLCAASLMDVASSWGAPPLGSLSQLASPFNCIGEVGYHELEIGCGTLLPAGAMNSSYQALVSPDGKNVYSVAIAGDLIEYSRNQTDGALTEIGCVSEGTSTCAPEHATSAIAIGSPAAIAISPNGRSAYVVTQGSNDALVSFTRDPETGLLIEQECISEVEAVVSECDTLKGKGLNNPYGVVVSPDGKNIYVSSHNDEAVAEFSRNTSTGAIAQLATPDECVGGASSGCVTNTAIGMEKTIGVAVSPDGGNVYVAAGGTEPGGALVAFKRNSETGALTQLVAKAGCVSTVNAACEPGTAIDGPEDLLVSPDGHNVYANSSKGNGAVLEFRREPSGALAQLASPNACVMNAPVEAGCTQAEGLREALGVAISPNGGNVYASSPQEDDEAAFTRDAGTGVLTQLPAPYECVAKTERSTCAVSDITGIAGARRVTVSPDGKNLYVAGQNDHSVVELTRVTEVPSGETPRGGAGSIPLPLPIVSPPPLLVPSPVLARTGNVAPVSGKVLVKVPGSKQFVPLQTLRQIPFGSVIDATNGTVSVTTALPGGKTQTGQFFAGEFILRQERNGLVVAELTGGNFSVCPTKRERSHIARAGSVQAYAAASGKHVVRKLWANAHGKFSTKGNYAAGAVQGTEWLTEDLCEGTLIRVTRDKVAVTNLVNHRHVEVKTGHKYLAKVPRG